MKTAPVRVNTTPEQNRALRAAVFPGVRSDPQEASVTDHHRVPAQRDGTAYVRITAADEDTAYRIADLIADHHPATAPTLRRTSGGLVACTLRASTLPDLTSGGAPLGE
ncbi:hypothetical protein [Actinacidiphila soli]|uniref:hypothetical protein n=1 Tax=Actinacidiphila soli TaxID=2487275 RepID=UPI000FCA7E0D|nr:hypothetical protein [Actinacidiphila soli]